MLNGMTPNPFYMISRAMGRGLMFNTILSVMLILRYCITFLRRMGLAHKFPLDQNIYFHMLVGWFIFVQAWIHTIAHLINFGKSLPAPVQMSLWDHLNCTLLCFSSG